MRRSIFVCTILFATLTSRSLALEGKVTDKKLAAYAQHPAITLVDELLAIPSPPGREMGTAKYLYGKIKAMGFKPEIDYAGNLLVRFTSGKKEGPVILAAHMDEIGLRVYHIEPDGRLRVSPSGGLQPHKIGERVVDILGDGDTVVQGVVSCGSGHADTSHRALTWDDCWIFTGLSEARLRAAGVHEGAAIVPAREGRGPLLFGDPDDPFLAAWTFDDRMGVVTLLRLLESMRKGLKAPDWPLIIAFTVHEEGGCHGAKVLAHREKPAAFIAVDGCPIMADAPLKVDGRPAIWIKDKKTCYTHTLCNTIIRVAKEAGVDLQRAVYSRPYSDASSVYDCGGAPAVAFMGHVRENSHGFEIARLSVFDQTLKVYEQLLRSWGGPKADLAWKVE